MTHVDTEEAQEWIAKALHGKPGRVEIHKGLPNDPAAPGRKNAEDQVESDTSTVADGCKDEAISHQDMSAGRAIDKYSRSVGPAENVSGDEEEHLAPTGSSQSASSIAPLSVRYFD
jgi:hypothetical protein